MESSLSGNMCQLHQCLQINLVDVYYNAMVFWLIDFILLLNMSKIVVHLDCNDIVTLFAYGRTDYFSDASISQARCGSVVWVRLSTVRLHSEVSYKVKRGQTVAWARGRRRTPGSGCGTKKRSQIKAREPA